MPGDRNHRTVVIDRTLPEIRDSLLKMSRLDILELGWMLMNVGAGLIEADADLVEKMGKLPEGLAFLLKAGKVSDLEACERFRIRRCVMRKALLQHPDTADIIRKQGLYAVLEVRANSIGGIRQLESLRDMEQFDVLSCIRISGLGRIDTPEWIETLEYIKGILGKDIDICPDNRFSMGNAIALEAAANGVSYVTTSYAGFGYGCSYAALEVVLSAMKMHRIGGARTNPEMLQRLNEQFAKCSRVKVIKNKPAFPSYMAGGWDIRSYSVTRSEGELVDA